MTPYLIGVLTWFGLSLAAAPVIGKLIRGPKPPPPRPDGDPVVTVDFYPGGSMLVHDHTRDRATRFTPRPGTGTDWDAELRKLTS